MRTVKFSLSLLTLALSVWLLFQLGSRFRSAPEETFTTLTGQRISLQQWRGKPVIVTFWASDCRSCMREIPHLLDLYEEFHAQGLELIAVAMAYDPPSHVMALTQERHLPYHVALDLSSAHALAFGDVKFTPTTFLIAPDGNIADQSVGVFDERSWHDKIAEMLKKG